jgi:hypothetical protein
MKRTSAILDEGSRDDGSNDSGVNKGNRKSKKTESSISSNCEIDKVDIDFNIIVKTDGRKHLCLITSVYNTLRTVKERLAFSNNNLEDPFLYFQQVTEKYKEAKVVEREGYNSTDMSHYLNELIRNHLIKSYIWKLVKHWDYQKLLNLKAVDIREHNIIVFGYGVPKKDFIHRSIITAIASDDCKYPRGVDNRKLTSYLKTAKGTHSGRYAQGLKVKALNNLKPEGSYVHGVSFHMTETGDVLLFDSKNDIVKTATPEEVSTSIHGAWAAYEFKIGV